MADKITTHNSVRRPWGIETLVTLDRDGTVYNWCVCTQDTPTSEDVESQATELTNAQEQRIAVKALRSEDVDTLEARKQALVDEINNLEQQKSELEAEVR